MASAGLAVSWRLTAEPPGGRRVGRLTRIAERPNMRQIVASAMKATFLDRLIERIDRVDPESLQGYVLRLWRERGFLETVFNTIQEGILVLDARGHIKYLNRAAEGLLGVRRASAIGRPIRRYLREVAWDRLQEGDGDAWEQLVHQEIEVRYPTRRILSLYAVPLGAEEGAFPSNPAPAEGAGAEAEGGLLLMVRDVTESRKRTEEAIEDERLSAIQLLAAGVAHEIGNPLNSLTIHLQLLDRGLRKLGREAEPLLELVSVARTEVGRLDGIVTQFLRAIRPTSPELALGTVNRVLEETLRFMEHEIRNRDIILEPDFGKRLPRILMDANQLRQAFFNIVNNAIQAMPTGGILEVTTRLDDDFVVVSFRDTGGGISLEDGSRIFDPFYTTRKSGSGVGLWIVQRIVRDHGGEIRIESTPGSGTLFTVRLPVPGRRLRLLEAHAGGGDRDGEGDPG